MCPSAEQLRRTCRLAVTPALIYIVSGDTHCQVVSASQPEPDGYVEIPKDGPVCLLMRRLDAMCAGESRWQDGAATDSAARCKRYVLRFSRRLAGTTAPMPWPPLSRLSGCLRRAAPSRRVHWLRDQHQSASPRVALKRCLGRPLPWCGDRSSTLGFQPFYKVASSDSQSGRV